MFCYTFEKIFPGRNDGYYMQATLGRTLSPILHTHDFFELFSVRSGSCLAEINGKEYSLQPGDTVLFAPGHTHRFLAQDPGTDLFSISVKREEFDSLRHLFAPEVPCSEPLLLMNNRDFCDFSLPYFCGAERLTAASTPEKRIFLAVLLESLGHHVQTCEKTPSSVIDSLENILSSDPSALAQGMAAMVSISGYSRSHLSRLILFFREETAGAFLRRLRLSYAYRSIVLTSVPLENIAESVGFSSYSHFHHIFSERYRISPAMLRKGIPGSTV